MDSKIYAHKKATPASGRGPVAGAGEVKARGGTPDLPNDTTKTATNQTTFDARQLTFVGPPKRADHQLIHSSESVEWYTPAVYIEAAREVMGSIDLDPASNEFANRIVKATRYFTIHDDGLLQPWVQPGGVACNVWLNPPYGKLNGASSQSLWLNKLIAEYKQGNVSQGMILVNAVTGYKWFAPMWDYPICFVSERIQFYTDGHKLGQNSPISNALAYLGDNEARFVEVFSQFGPVARRVSTPPSDGQLSLAQLGSNTTEINEPCSLTDTDPDQTAALPPGAPAGAWVELKMIPRGERVYGPYRYLRFRQGGRLRSRYLGKVGRGIK